MLCMLSPMSSLKTKCATLLLRGTFHTRGIGNDNKSISIARLGRLGSESETIGKTKDLIAPQPMGLIVPFETPGALLEGLRCLTASRPLPAGKEFQGTTMSRFLLITDLRLSEDDRQNVFWRSLRLDRNLHRGFCWNLNRTWRIGFSVLWQTRYRLRLRGCISPHHRSRTNAEHGAK
jgi:hypothetical protein